MVTVLLGAAEAPGLDRGQWSQGFWCSCCQNAGAAFRSPEVVFSMGMMAKSGFPETV